MQQFLFAILVLFYSCLKQRQLVPELTECKQPEEKVLERRDGISSNTSIPHRLGHQKQSNSDRSLLSVRLLVSFLDLSFLFYRWLQREYEAPSDGRKREGEAGGRLIHKVVKPCWNLSTSCSISQQMCQQFLRQWSSFYSLVRRIIIAQFHHNHQFFF